MPFGGARIAPSRTGYRAGSAAPRTDTPAALGVSRVRSIGWGHMPDERGACRILEPADLALLETLGTRRSASPGEYLYRQGDETYDFYVVLSGAVETVVQPDGAGARDRTP